MERDCLKYRHNCICVFLQLGSASCPFLAPAPSPFPLASWGLQVPPSPALGFIPPSPSPNAGVIRLGSLHSFLAPHFQFCTFRTSTPRGIPRHTVHCTCLKNPSRVGGPFPLAAPARNYGVLSLSIVLVFLYNPPPPLTSSSVALKADDASISPFFVISTLLNCLHFFLQ